MNKPQHQRGFTLLELLTVTAILGTLAPNAIPAYQQFSQRARFAEALLVVTPYHTAIEVAACRGDVTSVNDISLSTSTDPLFAMYTKRPPPNTLLKCYLA